MQLVTSVPPPGRWSLHTPKPAQHTQAVRRHHVVHHHEQDADVGQTL